MASELKKIRRWLFAHRRNRMHWGLVLAFAFLLFWFIGNVVSPYLAPAGTIDLGNSGLVGMDHEDEISQINNSFARFFYKMGDGNCHQRASRSLFLNDNQMPFCSRCTAIFLGMAIGMAIMIFLEMELNVIWIILGFAPIGVDGGLQLITGYESSNPVRFSTGLLAGMVTAIALAFIITETGLILAHRKEKKLRKRESK